MGLNLTSGPSGPIVLYSQQETGMPITKFTQGEFEFINHRLQARDALVEVMADDEDDAIAIYANTDLDKVFDGLEIKLHAGCDLSQLTMIERWILVDCIAGATLHYLAYDAQFEGAPSNKTVYARTMKDARGVIRKLAAAGIKASLPR